MAGKRTLEKKGARKNGVKRMLFVLLSLLLEVGFLLLFAFQLNAAAVWINSLTRIFSLLLVLGLYSKSGTSSMKTPWIILTLLLPVVGLSLYLTIGLNGSTRKMRRRYERVDRELLPLLPENRAELAKLREKNPGGGSVASYLLGKAEYPVYPCGGLTYYAEAADGLEAQIEELKKAEHFIFMEYHAIENAVAWQRLEEVLTDRVKAGVEVKVIYDDVGSVVFVDMDFAKHLRGLGIDCRVFNPMGLGVRLFINNRDHRKLTVIDGRVGFVGGYNLANEYFNITRPYGSWKDSGIRFTGPAVDSLTVTFLEMWFAMERKTRRIPLAEWLGRYLKQALSEEQMSAEEKAFSQGQEQAEGKFPPYGTEPAAAGFLQPYADNPGLKGSIGTGNTAGFLQPYADNPMDEERVGEEVYIGIINRSDRYCWFMTPYLIISDEMLHAIRLAAKRGVDVRILTPGIPDKKMIYRLTRSFYGELIRSGVRIYEWTPGFLHAKMCLSDDRVATVGTMNLDFRSLYHHFENGCVLYDCAESSDIREDFLKCFRESREVTEGYRDRKKDARLFDLFLKLFAGLL